MSARSSQRFHEIKECVEGRSDEEILAWMTDREGGAEALLNLVFEELPDALISERVQDASIIFQFIIGTPDGDRNYFAVIEDGKCTCDQGETNSPTAVMSMDVVVFLRILTGDLAPVRAFLGHKIKVSGDMMTATKFESWFARP